MTGDAPRRSCPSARRWSRRSERSRRRLHRRALVAIAWLAATDPKRRRAFRLPRFQGNRRPRLTLLVALAPAVSLLWAGNGVGLLVLLGTNSVAGWAMAAVSPVRTARATEWLGSAAARVGNTVRTAVEGATGAAGRSTSRIDALERRVAELEAALAAASLGDRTVARLSDYQAAKTQRAGEA